MTGAALTHVAVRTTDVDEAIEFYRRYARLVPVHDRVDEGIRVVWVGPDPDDPPYVVVLLQMPFERPAEPGANDHYGFAVDSREEIDRIGELAKADGRLKYGPAEGGPIVGYFVMVRDPSGNTCEFSYGQPIHPKQIRS